MLNLKSTTALILSASLAVPSGAFAQKHQQGKALEACGDPIEAPCLTEEGFRAVPAKGKAAQLEMCPEPVAEDALPCKLTDEVVLRRGQSGDDEDMAEDANAAETEEAESAEAEATTESEAAETETAEQGEPASNEQEASEPEEADVVQIGDEETSGDGGALPQVGDREPAAEETAESEAEAASEEQTSEASTQEQPEAETAGAESEEQPQDETAEQTEDALPQIEETASEEAAPADTAASGDTAAEGGSPAPGGNTVDAGDAAEGGTPAEGGSTTKTAEAEASTPPAPDPEVIELTEEQKQRRRERRQARREAEAAAAAASAAASAAEGETAAEVEVATEEVTAESARSATEDFSTSATGNQSASRDDDGLSTFEKALLVGLGAVAVGSILDNGEEVVSNSGDRVVLRDEDTGELRVLKDDDALLRQPGASVRTETFNDGSSRTVVTREDGTQIVTIRAADGRVVRRARNFPDGSQVILFDDTEAVEPVDVSTLPDPEPERTSVDTSDEDALRAALAAAERRELNRRFSLAQIREIREVRDLAPEIELDAITFASGSAAIQPSQAEELAALGRVMARIIEERPGEVFLIEGHTDAVGAAGYNLALSDRRAETVALALSEYFDVPPENMITQGYGEAQLKVPTLEDERRNRRAVVRRITPLLTASR